MDERDMPCHTHVAPTWPLLSAHFAPTWDPPPALYTNVLGKFQTQDLIDITSMLQPVGQVLINDILSYVIELIAY